MKEKEIIQGQYRSNKRGFGFVKIENEDEEVYIPKQYTNNALNEDAVLVKIIEDETTNKKKEGKIIKILKHGKTTVVGTFQNNRSFGFVVPNENTFGKDIFISKKNFNGAKNNQKVVVKITKFPEKNKKPEGIVTEVLGNINQAGVDMLALIKEYGLSDTFPKKVRKSAKKISEEIREEDLKNRRDLRDKIVFTIDGEEAKDLDDAVSVEKLENGNYMLNVHIADVSNYVKEQSSIDKEAIERGTSIYMLNTVIPMLPKELSNGICSLNEGKDRLTLSISMEIDKKGDVISSDVYKAIIKVTKRMSYTNVYKIITASDEAVLKEYKEYINNFKLMEELAIILKNKREEKGYLNLDIPESRIILDENGVAIDVKKYEINFANEIIEQFMLTANEQIAEKFYWLEAPFIYRVHEEPDIDKVKELNSFLFNLGYKIKGIDKQIYPKAFSEVINKIKDKPEEKVVSNLILRTLKVAEYKATNTGHFGIASKYYCHFTSPIRRYPDLFIHRIISKYIENEYNIDDSFKVTYNALAEKYAQSSSEAEKIAKKVERDSEDLKKAEYMQNKIGELYDGIISSITSFGMFVELENTVEGLVRFENMGNEYFEYDEDRKVLIGECSKVCYKVGDEVRIGVLGASKERRQIDFKLIAK